MGAYEEYMALRRNIDGLDDCISKESGATKDFLENYFKRKQSKDYMECGNCPIWHPSGCAHTCHGTFTTGTCDMIGGSLFAEYHECKLSAEERYDFMAKKGGELIESSGIQKDSVENRPNRVEKRLDKTEKKCECSSPFPDKIKCKDCSLFVYRGHLRPCDNGMEIGTCRITGNGRSKWHTCGLFAVDRDDFIRGHRFDNDNLRKCLYDINI